MPSRTVTSNSQLIFHDPFNHNLSLYLGVIHLQDENVYFDDMVHYMQAFLNIWTSRVLPALPVS